MEQLLKKWFSHVPTPLMFNYRLRRQKTLLLTLLPSFLQPNSTSVKIDQSKIINTQMHWFHVFHHQRRTSNNHTHCHQSCIFRTGLYLSNLIIEINQTFHLRLNQRYYQKIWHRHLCIKIYHTHRTHYER